MIVRELAAVAATKFWPEIEPYVAQALENDLTESTTVEEVRQAVADGDAVVLLAVDDDGRIWMSSVLSIFVDKKKRRTLHVLATAGQNRELWLPQLIDKLEEIAASEQCDGGVTLLGRPGWRKDLARYGWRTETITMRLQRGRNQQIAEPKPADVGKLQPSELEERGGQRTGERDRYVH